MKIWVVYFRGKEEFASDKYKDAEERAVQLLTSLPGTVQIKKEERA